MHLKSGKKVRSDVLLWANGRHRTEIPQISARKALGRAHHEPRPNRSFFEL